MRFFVWKDLYSIRRFLWPYIQRKFILYGYINRTSLKFQPMHAYDQQSWLIFHCLGSPFFFLDRLKSIVSKSSDQDFWIRLIWKVSECFATCHSSERIWPLSAAATCLIVSVTCWSSSISKKVVTSTKFKKN